MHSMNFYFLDLLIQCEVWSDLLSFDSHQNQPEEQNECGEQPVATLPPELSKFMKLNKSQVTDEKKFKLLLGKSEYFHSHFFH